MERVEEGGEEVCGLRTEAKSLGNLKEGRYHQERDKNKEGVGVQTGQGMVQAVGQVASSRALKATRLRAEESSRRDDPLGKCAKRFRTGG